MKKIIMFLLMILGMIGFTNAVDYDNISFTNEEFFNGAVTATKTIQINETHIAVNYLASGSTNVKICLLDGTSCSSSVGFGTSYNNIDFFKIENTDLAILVYSSTSSGSFRIINLTSLTFPSGGITFNSGSTNYVSAVQINSTDFAIAFTDVADSSRTKLIICKLDGSNCGSEILASGTSSPQNFKIILSSDDVLRIFQAQGGNSEIRSFTTSGSFVSQNTVNTGSTSYGDMIEGSDNKLKIVYSDDGNSNKGTFRTCDLDGTNCGSEVVFENSSMNRGKGLMEIKERLFFQYRVTPSNIGKGINFNLNGGEISSTYNFSNSNIVSAIDGIATTNNRILVSYNDATNSKGMFAISENLGRTTITFNNPTQNQYLNSTSFLLNVSFTQITNSTYKLNGGLETTLGTNTNESTENLIGIEGLNTLTVFTNTSGDLSNSSINFTIDTINPIITNNLPSEINSFEIDFSSYISINETNPYTCILEVVGQTNTTCDNSAFIFNNTGNNVINIYVNDSAGNIANDLNNIVLVNPLAYFNIEFNSTSLTGYTLGGRSDVNGTVSFNYYNDGLVIGNNSLTFEKLGYTTQTINFVLNTSAPAFNQTFNVSQAQINLFIKDKNTLNLITGVNFTIEFIASVGLTTSTTTGTKTLTNTLFQNEQYQVTVFADNYTTESVFFNFNNQESLDITLYSYDVTSPLYGVVDIKVVDTFGAAIEGAIVEALQWDSNTSSFIRVSQGLTTENGKSLLNIILNNKLYRFKASFGEFSKNTTQQYIPELLNGKEIIITLGDEITTVTGLFENIDYTITESFNNDTYQSNISFSWVNKDGLDTTGCIKYYRVQPSGLKTLLTNDCSTGASVDDLSVSKTLNSTYYIWAEVGFEQGGIFYIQQRFKYSPTFDISQILKETNLALYILPFIYLVAVFVGMLNPFVGSSLLILDNILAAYLVPQYMNGYIIAFMYFIAGLIMYAGGRRQ